MRALPVVVAVAAAAALSTASPAEARSCPDFQVRSVSFDDVSADGVTCARAKKLIDRAARAQGFPPRYVTWRHGGWRWVARPADDSTRRIIGKRGGRKVEAWWTKQS